MAQFAITLSKTEWFVAFSEPEADAPLAQKSACA